MYAFKIFILDRDSILLIIDKSANFIHAIINNFFINYTPLKEAWILSIKKVPRKNRGYFSEPIDNKGTQHKYLIEIIFYYYNSLVNLLVLMNFKRQLEWDLASNQLIKSMNATTFPNHLKFTKAKR